MERTNISQEADTDGIPHTGWLADFVQEKAAEGTPMDAEGLMKLVQGGIGLPRAGQFGHPYALLIKGFDEIEEQYGADERQKIAEQFARKIKECWPELQEYLLTQHNDTWHTSYFREGEYEERRKNWLDAHYNLWFLMANLKQPAIFGPIIRGFVNASLHEPGNAFSSLRDDSGIISLPRMALLFAAIYNQDTDEFRSDWGLIMKGAGRESRFRCMFFQEDGIEGLLQCPDSTLRQLMLGEALKVLMEMDEVNSPLYERVLETQLCAFSQDTGAQVGWVLGGVDGGAM